MSETKCTFCSIVRGELPCYRVYEDEEIIAFLDINPVAAGHTLVLPKVHIATLIELPDELVERVFHVAKDIGRAFYSMGYTGVNYLVNEGSDAGQVIFHLHCHVLPRRQNDGVSLRMGRLRMSRQEMESVAADLREMVVAGRQGR